MNVLQVIGGIILCVVSVFLVVIVLLQPGKSSGLSGAITGGAETFFGKNKARSYEGKMAKLTKIGVVVFIVLSIAMVLMQKLNVG